MGYTHYWTPKVASPKQWKEFIGVCKRLHKELPDYSLSAGGYYEDDNLELFGGMGTGKPVFTLKEVWFNGDERKDLDLETFCLAPKKLSWAFCKTERKPYDLMVIACLIAAHQYLGYEVSSDGSWDDWKPGIEFYLNALYQKMPDKKEMKVMLPKFLFDDEDGTKYYEYKNKYNVMDYIKSLFVVVD